MCLLLKQRRLPENAQHKNGPIIFAVTGLHSSRYFTVANLHSCVNSCCCILHASQPSFSGRTIVIAASNRVAHVDNALRRPGRFDREIEIGVPPPHARTAILRAKLAPVRHVLSDSDVELLAARCHGFVGADLAALVAEATHVCLRRAIRAVSGASGETMSHKLPDSTRQTTEDNNSPRTNTDHTQPTPSAQLASTPHPRDTAPSPSPAASTLFPQPPNTHAVTLSDITAALTRVRPSALRDVHVLPSTLRWRDIGG